MNNFNMAWLFAALSLALTLNGCDQFPTGGANASTSVVVDLETVAKVTGQDVVIEQRMTAMREDLSRQLNAMAADLEQQLADERAKIGDADDEGAQQRIQQLIAQAQQQMAQQRTLAQQQAQQYQTGLVRDFRAVVQPVSSEIASARGASVILIYDPMMLWFEPSIDITDEVISALSDQNIEFPSSGIEAEPAGEISVAPDGPAEVTAPAGEISVAPDDPAEDTAPAAAE